MKLVIPPGTTSYITEIFVQNSSVTTGAGLAGLVFNSAGLTWYYSRSDQGNVGGTQVTLATMTRGTWATGGFIEKDATNMPGFYQIGIPNAVLATGASWATMVLRGATNMAPVPIEIQLESIPSNFKRNVAQGIYFSMVDSGENPVTGATFTSRQVSLDGAAYATLTNNPTEIAAGSYFISLTAAETNGDAIRYRFAASGARDTLITVYPHP